MNTALPPPRRPWSMTARLVTLQVAVLSLLLGGALVALYSMISAHLQRDNRELLHNQTVVLARWLADLADHPPQTPRERADRLGLLATIPEIYVRLLEADGTEVLASPGFPHPQSSTFPTPGEGVVAWASPTRQSFLLQSTWMEPANGHARRMLQVAYDVSDDDTLLRQLRQRMLLTALLALVLSSLLALLIARGVFRPLAQLTAVAAQVHASQLSSRVADAGWPAELTALARELDAMLQRLDESFRRLARFSSDLSHELRTPINNLRGEAEVALSRPRQPEEYRAVLESSLEECARLGRLIETLLFIAKADHPAEGITRRILDAHAECQAVMEFFEPMASERGVTILVRGNGTIYGNADLLRRALANLLDNAVRHTAAGGHIDLTVRENAAGGTDLEIRDNGEGIAEEHLPRVFERFYRSERSQGEGAPGQSTSGFGLGLAIVKSIMDMHGVRMDLKSSLGSGTTVTLAFPPAAGEK